MKHYVNQNLEYQGVYTREDLIQKMNLTEVPSPPTEGLVKPRWINNEWVETATPEEIEEANKPFVPEILSPRQFRLALIHTGKSIANIEAFIKNLPSPINEKVWITWEYSIQFERFDPMLNEFAESLEITQEQLDQIFILGATL